MRHGIQTQDQDLGIDRLHHCARRLVVLIYLWSPNSSICSLCGQIDLYIGCIPCKWKQICACWTCGCGSGNGGFPICYGGSSILLEARRRVFSMERDSIGVRVRRVPRQRPQIRSTGLISCLFLPWLFWSLLEHEVYKKHCSVIDLVRPMWWKELGGGTGWPSAGVLVFYICSVFLL